MTAAVTRDRALPWWRELLSQPRWLAGLAVAVVFACVCVALAQWQWHRKEVRDTRNSAVTANYDRSPVVVSGSLPSVEAEIEWTPVRIRGTYDPSRTVLVRNRPLGGANGYLVVVPFSLATDESRVWLVRGWIPAGDDAAVAPVPQSPARGPVTVVARLRVGEATAGAPDPIPGQAYRVDPVGLAQAAGLDGVPDPTTQQTWAGYGVVASEDAAPLGEGVVATLLPRPDIDPGPHLAYTIQWYLFAAAGVLIWATLFRRERLTGSGDDAGVREVWTYRPGG